MIESFMLKISSISRFSWKSYLTKFPTFAPPPTIHLGRWCHADFNKKCDVDIKADLANLDNGFFITSNKPLTKSKSKLLILFRSLSS